jgi:uncharacterized membrane protein
MGRAETMIAPRCVLVALFVTLAACDVGEVPSGAAVDAGTGGATTQAARFDTVIKPLVTRCTACHGTTQAPNFTSYAALDARYKTAPGASNILVIKADATGGTHQGITYFSATEKTTVATWIDGK